VTCEYYGPWRDGERQAICGKPATWRGSFGLLLCTSHVVAYVRLYNNAEPTRIERPNVDGNGV